MPLEEEFSALVDRLPSDWSEIELDLRLEDETRYVDAAVLLAQCNAQPYSRHDWHWRLRVANGFGHAASAETVAAVLGQLDAAGIRGELALRELREGRVEVVPMWGRPESLRQELARRRFQ